MAQTTDKKKSKKETKHVVLYEDTHIILSGIKVSLRTRGYNVKSIDGVVKYLAAYYITKEAETPRNNVRTMRLNAPDDDANNYEEAIEELEEIENELDNENYGY